MSKIKLQATDGNGGTISLKGPTTTDGNAEFELTLPANDGSAGQYLKTDGSGALSWDTVSAGSAKIEKFDSKVEVTDTDGQSVGKISAYIDNTELLRIDGGAFVANGVPLRLGDITGQYANGFTLQGNQSSANKISSGQQDIVIEAGGVNNNVNTYHDLAKFIHSPGSGTTATKVELYASNVKRFETSTTGATVTGTLTATSFAGSGAALTGISSPSSFRNLIVNGSCIINQRGTVTGVTTSSYGGADRWKASLADAPGTWQLSQVADAPTGSGFSHCLEYKVTTANGTLDAGDEAVIQTTLEGQELTHIKKGTSSAEQLTLSFWCKSSTTGTYIAELYDTDNDRQCSKSYTVSAGDTWEKKTITFPADTTGAFTVDNQSSLAVKLWIAAGTTWTSGTLSTTWTSPTDANRAVGQVNLSATLNNYFRMTGVQLEVGDTATSFEHKPYRQVLEDCRRYLWVWSGGISMHADRTTDAHNCGRVGQVFFPTTMRHAPTVSNMSMTVYTGSAQTLGTYEIDTDHIWFNHSGSFSDGRAWARINSFTADAEI